MKLLERLDEDRRATIALTTSQKSEGKRRGRPKDPDVQLRRGILKEQIMDTKDLNDPKKVHSLFGRFDREGIKPYHRTKWLELEDPQNKSEYDLVLSNLRRDLSRR